MATLNLEPAISTRYRIERVMYRVVDVGIPSIETRAQPNRLAHCSTANSARATESAWSLATLAEKVHVGVSAPQQGVSRFLSCIGS